MYLMAIKDRKFHARFQNRRLLRNLSYRYVRLLDKGLSAGLTDLKDVLRN